jgi:hypothetical protein
MWRNCTKMATLPKMATSGEDTAGFGVPVG